MLGYGGALEVYNIENDIMLLQNRAQSEADLRNIKFPKPNIEGSLDGDIRRLLNHAQNVANINAIRTHARIDGSLDGDIRKLLNQAQRIANDNPIITSTKNVAGIGISPSIDAHSGGIIPGAHGQEVPIMALAGERVQTEQQQREGGGGVTVNLHVGNLIGDHRAAMNLMGILAPEIRRLARS